MHPSISMRSMDPGILDVPPSAFDYGTADFDFPLPMDTIVEAPAAPPTTANFQAIKIARAVAGTTEIRLLRKSNGEQGDTFILEDATLQPYACVREELLKSKDEPMTEAQALKAFDTAVQEKYPAEKLRSGRVVPIHQNLL